MVSVQTYIQIFNFFLLDEVQLPVARLVGFPTLSLGQVRSLLLTPPVLQFFLDKEFLFLILVVHKTHYYYFVVLKYYFLVLHKGFGPNSDQFGNHLI